MLKNNNKILIVEDEAMIAEDIREHLEEGGYEVVDIAYNGKSACHLLSRRDIDLAILDIRLKGEMSGVEVAQFINAQIHIPFIFLTSHADKNTLADAKQTRPGGYLLKPFTRAGLLSSIEVALFNHESSDLPQLDVLNEQLPSPLSQREYELLIELKKGGSNQDVADSLGISLNTVKSHLYHAFAKLDAANRTDALYRLEQLARGKGPLGK
ncbi:MAG: response regulator transcription factor [Flavobacteriales bacterium]|nr:response regulator transcription factor [Flavobacteriales bacterium]